MPAGKCAFNDMWLQKPEYAAWLVRDRENKHHAHCNVCRRSFDISNMGEPALRSHSKGNKHCELVKVKTGNVAHFFRTVSASACTPMKPEETTLTSRATTSSCKDFVSDNDTLVAEIIWVLHTIEKHGSYHANEGIKLTF